MSSARGARFRLPAGKAIGNITASAPSTRRPPPKSSVSPIAFPAGSLNRAPRADDIAGLSDVYGNDHFRASTGSITGRVTKNGAGVLGAHVVAFNPGTGTLVGGFSLTADGAFTIGGLAEGLYVVRAEPIDDGDVGSFLDPSQPIDLEFRPAIYTSLVAVPRGGTARNIEVKVTPK